MRVHNCVWERRRTWGDGMGGRPPTRSSLTYNETPPNHDETNHSNRPHTHNPPAKSRNKQVTKKLLEGEEMQALKVRFYKLMIEYHSLSGEKVRTEGRMELRKEGGYCCVCVSVCLLLRCVHSPSHNQTRNQKIRCTRYVGPPVHKQALTDPLIHTHNTCIYLSICAQDAFEIAQHYHAIYDTPAVQAEEAQWRPALEACILFVIISPHR